jgi:hypothetical protein
MATYTQNFPENLRSGSPAAPAPDRRPYLISVPPLSVPPRKPAAPIQKYLALFPHESEDARLTGATRSLYRRLLALNLPRPAASIENPSEMREMRVTVTTSKIA